MAHMHPYIAREPYKPHVEAVQILAILGECRNTIGVLEELLRQPEANHQNIKSGVLTLVNMLHSHQDKSYELFPNDHMACAALTKATMDYKQYVLSLPNALMTSTRAVPRPPSIQVHVTPNAQRLANLTARMLPAAHRGRYVEELQAELWDLASARATKSMQLLYAFQQLGRVWQLRRELLVPGRCRGEVLLRWASWVLESDVRTWIPLSAIVILALINVVIEQGWGSAFLAAPTAWVFHKGVQRLRTRWGIQPPDKDRARK
ncbi:hypothetical protein BJ981_002063 [Sphaerisporangium krabiense]|uniref:Uncharacterized protein n=1 Tax=Sphaerisporangium krabiense TaxID=763782 RepID=A0A7W9DPV7_9ACTN|nr:hypothetical protein [Sphaerisporangium krabiense]